MSDGQYTPTVYAALVDRALEVPLPGWQEAVESESEGLKRRLSSLGEEALRQAYIAGLRDGFQQGIEAAARREEQA